MYFLILHYLFILQSNLLFAYLRPKGILITSRSVAEIHRFTHKHLDLVEQHSQNPTGAFQHWGFSFAFAPFRPRRDKEELLEQNLEQDLEPAVSQSPVLHPNQAKSLVTGKCRSAVCRSEPKT